MNVELYHDPAKNVLVYRGQGSEKLVGAVPGATLAGGYVVLRDSLYARQLIRWLDLPAPPPMANYDYPRNRLVAPEPTVAQKAMANFLVLHPKSFNLSDMGTMKTLAACWAAEFVMQQFEPGKCRAIILAPLSTLQRVWGDALFNHFAGRRTFSIVHGSSADARRRALSRAADFYIINFDGLAVGANTKKRIKLGGLSQDLYERTDIRIAIIDEASAYRDRRTRRSRIARLLVGQRDYLWLLTATPVTVAPTDAFGLALLVNNAFGESFTAFERRTMVQINDFKKVPARGGYEAAARLLQPAIRFDIKDIWDGPGVTYQLRDIDLTPLQAKMLRELKNQKVMELGDRTMAVPNEAVIRNKALQICMGAVYDDKHKAWSTEARARITELKNLIREATAKVLVFVPLTSVINLLYDELYGKEDIGECIILNGSVARPERDRLVSSFKDEPAVRVALCDPAVVAHGINEFVAATTVVWFGPTDKPELYAQGNARAHRPGQKFPVTVCHIAATALERGIFDRLAKNLSMQGVMLDWIKDERL